MKFRSHNLALWFGNVFGGYLLSKTFSSCKRLIRKRNTNNATLLICLKLFVALNTIYFNSWFRDWNYLSGKFKPKHDMLATQSAAEFFAYTTKARVFVNMFILLQVFTGGSAHKLQMPHIVRCSKVTFTHVALQAYSTRCKLCTR